MLDRPVGATVMANIGGRRRDPVVLIRGRCDGGLSHGHEADNEQTSQRQHDGSSHDSSTQVAGGYAVYAQRPQDPHQ